MEKRVRSIWQRVVALICSFAMIASYLPAQSVFAESRNGYATSISASETEVKVGETITFKAAVDFKAEESTDEEAEDFSFEWFVNDEKKAEGEEYELKTDSVEGYEEEYEVYFKATGKASGNTLTSSTKNVRFYNLYTIKFSGADEDDIESRGGREIDLPDPEKSGHRFVAWKDSEDNTYNGGGQYTVKGNATLTAQWQETVKVSFDPDGGSLDDDKKSVTIDKGTSLSEDDLPTPVRKHYGLLGWFTDKDKKTEYDGGTINGDITLYAKWEQTEFVVTFDPNGGTIPESKETITVGKGENNLKEDDFPDEEDGVKRDHYTLAGWSKDGKTKYEGGTVHEDTTLVALWEQTEFEVSFDANGGNNAPDSVWVKKGEAVPEETLEKEPSWEGHNFQGWKIGDVKYTDQAITKEETLKADWNLKTFKVGFDANGGKVNGKATDSVTKEYDSYFGDDLPEPERESKTEDGKKTEYKFKKWVSTSDSEKELKKDTHIRDNWEVEAKWDSVESYQVTYVTEEADADGTLPEGQGNTEWIEEGKAASCPKLSPKNEAGAEIQYEFAGWYSDEERTNEYNGEAIKEAKTLYAHFIKMYRVSFVTSGESKDGVYVKEGEGLKKTDAEDGLSYDGYIVAGFFMKEDYSEEYSFGENDVGEEITAPITLYVRWKPNTFTIVYDKNADDAEGSMEEQSREYDDGKALLENGFSRKGYKFEKWYTKKADGTPDQEYTDGFEGNLTTENDTTVTLYASWKANTYIVRFHANYVEEGKEQEDTDDQEAFAYDTPENLKTNVFTRNGYSGYVWATDREGADGSEWFKDGELVLNLTAEDNAVVDLYAIWIDTEAPVIKYYASEAQSGGTIFDRDKITYTITITDEGSGIDTNQAYYYVDRKGTATNAEEVPAERWKKTALKQTTDGEGNVQYQFDVNAPAKGTVFIKISDKAVEAVPARKELTVNGEKMEVDSVSGVQKKPNVGYQKIRLVVLETEAPYISVEADNEEYARNHTFNVIVDDTKKRDGTESDEYSGIREVWYSIKDSKGSDVNNYTVNLYQAGTIPSTLEEIARYKSFTKDGNEIIGQTHDDKPKLDGDYTLTVYAYDFCGNGGEEKGISIPLHFDNTAPTITISAEGGNQYDGVYYYNDETWNDESITITDEHDLGSYAVTAEGGSGGSEKWEKESFETSTGEVVIGGKEGIVKAKDLGEGTITFKATATDAAGNETQEIVADGSKKDIAIQTAAAEPKVSEASFVYDNTAPALKITMKDGKKYEDNNEYYYRADNCGLTVEIGNEGDTTNIYRYTVLVKNIDTEKEIRQELVAGTNGDGENKLTKKIPSMEDEEQTGVKVAENVTVQFSKDEMQKLGDGHIEVTAVACDCSLNENDAFKDNDGESGIKGLKDTDADMKKGSFVLDMTNPVVTSITTIGTAKGKGNGEPYQENGENFYYYSEESVLTTFTISDVNPYKRAGSYTYEGGDVIIPEALSEVVESGEIAPEETVSFEFVDEGRYTNIVVTGEDKAGNKLDLPADYTYGAVDVDAAEAKDGKVKLLNGKALDRTPPSIVLSMTGGNQYDGIWYYNETNCDQGKVTIGKADDVALLKSYVITATSEADSANPKTWTFNVPESEEDLENAQNVMKRILNTVSKLEDGKISITVTATDRAENENKIITLAPAANDQINLSEDASGQNEASFILDKKAPALTVAMKEGKEYTDANQFYYRADNCGLTVKIGNEGDASDIYSYTVLVKNADTGKEIRQELSAGKNGYGDNKLTKKIPSRKDVIQSGVTAAESITVSFTKEEMQTLGDGHIEVTATVLDYAKNKNSTFRDSAGNNGITGLKDAAHNMKKGTFVLDMTNPVVSEIRTGGTARGQAIAGVEDAAPYDEGDAGTFYYYNDKTVTTTFTVLDVNLDDWNVSYKKDGTTVRQDKVKSTAVVTKGTDNQTQRLVAQYYDKNRAAASSEGRFTDISVSGADKAGNPLVLKPDYSYTGKGSKEVDPAYESVTGSGNNRKGIVTLNNGKVIDRTPPVATLTYSTNATAYLYNGKNVADGSAETNQNGYSIATAYVNQAFKASVAIKDTYDGENGKAAALDFDKLTVRQYGHDPIKLTAEQAYKKNGTVGYVFNVKPDKDNGTDGAYFYKVFGTDRAGNEMKVLESVAEGTKTKSAKAEDGKKDLVTLEKQYKTENCRSTYHAKLRFILDTVCPEFTFTLADPKGDETIDGNTVYYGSATNKLSGTFKVVDRHIDVKRIGTGVAFRDEKNIEHYTDVVSNEKQKLKWTDVKIEHIFSNDGSVFTDTIDRNKEGIYRFGISGVDKAGNPVVQSSKEKEKTGYLATVPVEKEKNDKYWTYDKVLDRTAPIGTLDIGSYYHVDMKRDGTNELKTSTYDPYRSEKSAKISIKSKDLSPVRITYNIESTVSGQGQKHDDADYKNNIGKETSVSGEQIFNVSDLVLIDRAGNKSGFIKEGQTKANKIYLDKTRPANKDVEKPVATIKATSAVTKSNADGRDLFNHEVRLKISVTDPYEKVKSAGLKSVTYTVKVDGNTDNNTSGTKAFNDKKAPLYKEESFEYAFTKEIVIPKGGKYETNNIEIEVTAVDNAGNEADKVTYKFGIDTVGPTIVVDYDNDSAQNGFYFNKDRIGTVRVTDRNIDDGKISIKTQISYGRFQNERHSGNGKDDTWVKKLSYTADGNYTLDISGTDALGNKAKVSFANGTVAPNKFTIDKTAPGVTVTYDNNDVRNEKYYKASRKATISINDVNFGGENDIKVVSTGEGSVPASVTFTGNTATISFPDDGVYVFNGSVTDLAGNKTTIPVQTEFVVDTKAPVLLFEDGNPFKVVKAQDEKSSDHPVDKQFFTEDVFAPKVTVVDTNISPAAEDYLFEIIGTKSWNHYTGKKPEDDDEKITQFDISLDSITFKVDERIDDVYHVKAFAIDKAGNESEPVEFTFSINRFGSTYETGNKDTEEYIRTYYYHNTTRDLEIREYNVNAIKKDSQSIEVMKDGNTATVRKLEPGKDYDFAEDTAFGSHSGGRIYKYTIHSSVFEEEGDYSFTISSEDEAGHKNSTSRIHRSVDEETGEVKTFVDSFPIEFSIDKTPPTNQLAGISSETKQSVNDRSLLVDVYPEDAQSAVGRVVISNWTGDTLGFTTPDPGDRPAQAITYEYYDKETNPKPADTEQMRYEDLAGHTEKDSGRIKIVYEITDNQNWQWVEVKTTDLAGNESTDIRAGSGTTDAGVSYTENRRGFLVTTDAFSQIINNMAARVGASAAVVLLLLFLILWKRKKDREKEAAA